MLMAGLGYCSFVVCQIATGLPEMAAERHALVGRVVGRVVLERQCCTGCRVSSHGRGALQVEAATATDTAGSQSFLGGQLLRWLVLGRLLQAVLCCSACQVFVNEDGGRHKFFNVWPYIKPLQAWIYR